MGEVFDFGSAQKKPDAGAEFASTANPVASKDEAEALRIAAELLAAQHERDLHDLQFDCPGG